MKRASGLVVLIALSCVVFLTVEASAVAEPTVVVSVASKEKEAMKAEHEEREEHDNEEESEHDEDDLFHPIPFDPAKPPPEGEDMTPEDWFAFMKEMEGYQGIRCIERPRQDDVYDFLRHQFDHKKMNMPYERIVGGLFLVHPDRDNSWYGFCLERVLADGNPEAHPKVEVPFQAKYKVVKNSAGGTEKHYFSPKLESSFPNHKPRGLEHGSLDWDDFQSHRIGNNMFNLCQCDCKAAQGILASKDPLGCTCHCKPQRGKRGIAGIHGKAGARGPRGIPGRKGGPGPRGPPGRLPIGTYKFIEDPEQCYIEDWSQTMAQEGWSECLKPGYFLKELFTTSSGVSTNGGSCDTIDCVRRAKCCRPKLIISNEPAKASLRYSSRPTTAHSFEGMEPKGISTIFDAAHPGAKGYCDRYLSDFRHEGNERTCFHEGSSKDVITRIKLRFSPIDTKEWKFRFGGDFDGGAMMLVDGVVRADNTGKSTVWNREWTDKSGVLSAGQVLESGRYHEIVVWGFSQSQSMPMEFQFNTGSGWKKVSYQSIMMACRTPVNA